MSRIPPLFSFGVFGLVLSAASCNGEVNVGTLPTEAGASGASTGAANGSGSSDAGSGDAGGGSGSGSGSGALNAACDHYLAAQSTRCGGPALPISEASRVRARFEQVCRNQAALPGSSVTPAALEACATALDASSCQGRLAECTFFGSLPGGAACNEGLQCQSGVCKGTADFSPGGQIGPVTCGTCEPVTTVGQICGLGDFSAGCPANSICLTKETTVKTPTYTCTSVVQGDLGASCDDLAASCKAGLYCDAQTKQCTQLGAAGAQCPNGDTCAAPLSCVGNRGTATCTIAAAGGFCLYDFDCASGLLCLPGPCTPNPGGGFSCPGPGTCQPVVWAAAGQSCDSHQTRCLVGSCFPSRFGGMPGMPVDGGVISGTCPQIVADGNSTDTGNTYSTCDTFAELFDPIGPAGRQGAVGKCTLLDSVVCGSGATAGLDGGTDGGAPPADCNPGLYPGPCCPPDVASGQTKTCSTEGAMCWRASCADHPFTSTMSCSGGVWNAGMGLLPCPDAGAVADPLVGTWTYSGNVPARVVITLTFNSDKTFAFVEQVAPAATPVPVDGGPEGCVTTHTFLGTYAETVSGGANTLTWTFAGGTANAVSGCNPASYDTAGTPMTADSITAYRAQGLIPPTPETYTVTSTTLVLTPPGNRGFGLGATTTFTRSP
ncbi:MAG TPA: hypothetical protein VGY54_22120 [Polyangiaceae bacterium]|jgi:hypothetical protein|nr:hypothetical protein [Polyangiaceae bacterium]